MLRIYQRADGRAETSSDVRDQFGWPLLARVLEFTISPSAGPDAAAGITALSAAPLDKPIVLAYIGAWDEDPDAKIKGKKQTPSQILERALSSADLPYGFLITGERVRLIRRPGEGPRGAYLEIYLPGCVEDEDRDSFSAFYRIFHSTNFIRSPAGHLSFELFETDSRAFAEKVSQDLRRAVFVSAETLGSGLISDFQRCTAGLPAGDALAPFRDAALLTLYRLLFILYAEARDERLTRHALYMKSYSLQSLIDDVSMSDLHDQPANRFGLWKRLVALFRIYNDGLPRIDQYENIPPRGGDFFSALTAEGRIIESVRLNDRLIAQVILDLTTTAPRRGVGRERVSFRELDIEQLGAVYEGLLEFEPRVAPADTFEIEMSGRTLALRGDELIRICREKYLRLAGDENLVEGTPLADYLGSDQPKDEDEDTEGADDAEDDEAEGDEDKGVKKGGVIKLIRRIDPGRFYFSPGSARKGSGSFYTPKALVEDIVRHAIGPAVQKKSADEILRLRVLDPACGSGHFLIAAMRYLGQSLHRAYAEHFGSKPPPDFTRGVWDADWKSSDAQARFAGSEARAWCKRRIAENCLFGVDLNPTAVQLARVALWIESLAGDRPLTYFEHHIRCGNSLLSSWLDGLDRHPLEKESTGGSGDLFAKYAVEQEFKKAAELRNLIPEARAAVEPESIKEMRYKEDRRKEAEDAVASAKLLFDLRLASVFGLADIWNDWTVLTSLLAKPSDLAAYAEARPWWNDFVKIRDRERCFHWELEFPEVLRDPDRPGFDAVVGNPPWDKVLPSKHEFYARCDVLIRAYKGNDLDRRIRELHQSNPDLAEEFKQYRERTTTVAQILRKSGDFPLSEARSGAAHEDVSKYFVDRSARLAADKGAVGLVSPSVLYNGDGAVGIRRFLLEHTRIERFYGFENRKKLFPIHASYKFVSLVFRKGDSADGFDAAFMRHDLAELTSDSAKPWVVRITREEIARLSPETLAFLEYRSPRDQQIVQRMHKGRPTLGGDGPGAWGAEFFNDFAHNQIYNATRDKDLWTDPKTGKLYAPAAVLGKDPKDMGEAVRKMRDHGFWPVYEGKHIDQFVVGTKPVRWWLSVEQAAQKYGKKPREESTLVFRETASNTNERTCIAAVIDDASAGSHTLTGILFETVKVDAALSILNSLCFDFCLRKRTAGTHLSFTYMRPMPVPPADVVNRLPRIPTKSAWEAGIKHITDDRSLWPKLWESNRAVAEAYGLGPDDFAHILTTFPVFARKRKEFYAYLQERLVEWKTERKPKKEKVLVDTK